MRKWVQKITEGSDINPHELECLHITKDLNHDIKFSLNNIQTFSLLMFLFYKLLSLVYVK